MLRKLYFFKFANLKKTKQKNSTHKSLGVAAYNTCKKFQGKIVNPTLVGTPGSFFFFLKKDNCSLVKNKSLSKITHQYFSVQNCNNQTKAKFVLKSNIEDIHIP